MGFNIEGLVRELSLQKNNIDSLHKIALDQVYEDYKTFILANSILRPEDYKNNIDTIFNILKKRNTKSYKVVLADAVKGNNDFNFNLKGITLDLTLIPGTTKQAIDFIQGRYETEGSGIMIDHYDRVIPLIEYFDKFQKGKVPRNESAAIYTRLKVFQSNFRETNSDLDIFGYRLCSYILKKFYDD